MAGKLMHTDNEPVHKNHKVAEPSSGLNDSLLGCSLDTVLLLYRPA